MLWFFSIGFLRSQLPAFVEVCFFVLFNAELVQGELPLYRPRCDPYAEISVKVYYPADYCCEGLI